MKREPVTVPLKRIGDMEPNGWCRAQKGDLEPNGWCRAHKKTWYLMDGAKYKKTWNLMDGAKHQET